MKVNPLIMCVTRSRLASSVIPIANSANNIIRIIYKYLDIEPPHKLLFIHETLECFFSRISSFYLYIPFKIFFFLLLFLAAHKWLTAISTDFLFVDWAVVSFILCLVRSTGRFCLFVCLFDTSCSSQWICIFIAQYSSINVEMNSKSTNCVRFWTSFNFTHIFRIASK